MMRSMNNDTRRQRLIREALGPDPVTAFGTTALRVTFVFALLAMTGFASALGTHDVPVVNGTQVSSAAAVTDVTMLAALISDANRDD